MAALDWAGRVVTVTVTLCARRLDQLAHAMTATREERITWEKALSTPPTTTTSPPAMKPLGGYRWR